MVIESIVTSRIDLLVLGTLLLAFWIIPGGAPRHVDELTSCEDDESRRLTDACDQFHR